MSILALIAGSTLWLVALAGISIVPFYEGR
jgi:hypothetical protein